MRRLEDPEATEGRKGHSASVSLHPSFLKDFFDMAAFGATKIRDEVILLARILMILLFLIFGWGKMTNFSGTMRYFASDNLPMPAIATLIAVIMEFFVGLALLLGVFTRPLAIILAIYTLATGLIGHEFWNMTGADYTANEINFFKNFAIIGGLLLLYTTGAGKYSIDRKLQMG
jgi:putative oxidoreductase